MLAIDMLADTIPPVHTSDTYTEGDGPDGGV
jgi:hypothetical protein